MVSKCQCCEEAETINHVLMNYKESKKVWRWFSDLFHVPILPHTNVEARFMSWVNSSDKVGDSHIKIMVPIMIGSYLWLARNEAKYKATRFNSVLIIQKIGMFLVSAHQAKWFSRKFQEGDERIAITWNIQLTEVPRPKPKIIIWSKPPESWIKVNTDGAYQQVNSRAACGGIIRDSEGRMLRCFQNCFIAQSVIYAELVGI